MFHTVFRRAACLAALPFVPVALAQTPDGTGRDYMYRHGPGMMWGGDGWGSFGMFLGPLYMVAVLAVIVVGIFYLLHMTGAVSLGRKAAAPHTNAVALLHERYARGEIDSTEYQERRRLLTE